MRSITSAPFNVGGVQHLRVSRNNLGKVGFSERADRRPGRPLRRCRTPHGSSGEGHWSAPRPLAFGADQLRKVKLCRTRPAVGDGIKRFG